MESLQSDLKTGLHICSDVHQAGIVSRARKMLQYMGRRSVSTLPAYSAWRMSKGIYVTDTSHGFISQVHTLAGASTLLLCWKLVQMLHARRNPHD